MATILFYTKKWSRTPTFIRRPTHQRTLLHTRIPRMRSGLHCPHPDLVVRQTSSDGGGGVAVAAGVDFEEVVEDDEEHGEGAEEDGEGVEGRVGDHLLGEDEQEDACVCVRKVKGAAVVVLVVVLIVVGNAGWNASEQGCYHE
jgi:hypothetical protein